jgi:hypothetical protein
MAETFQSLTMPPEVSFATTLVQPPTFSYLAANEAILVRVQHGTPAVPIEVMIRFLRADGELVPVSDTIRVQVSDVLEEHIYYMPEGFLLGVVVAVPTGASGPGMTYVDISLFREGAAPKGIYQLLTSGYIHRQQPLAWPSWPSQNMAEGPGMNEVTPVLSPGAGLNWAYTIPTGQRWVIQNIRFQFSASATVLNRNIAVRSIVSGSAFVWGITPVAVTASQAFTISCTARASVAPAGFAAQVIEIPANLSLVAGQTIEGTSTSIDPADAFTGISILHATWRY